MELKNNLAIDFDSFSDTLTQILLEDSEVFRSIYPGSTSKILVDTLAGYASMLMYRLQAAVSNSFLQTAFSEYSILTAAEMLGVSITGNTGSSIDLTLSRNAMESAGFPEISIPLYTNFEINGLNFYNREIYTFPQGYRNIHITLYQGEMNKKEFSTTGTMNERFEFGNNFTTDLNSVKVFIDGKEWKTDRETILDYATSDEFDSTDKQVVLLRTDSTGISYIQFGNGLYGSIPMANSIVLIYYATCDGSSGNFSGASEVSLKDNILFGNEVLDVYSNSIGTSSGGSDRITASMLKYMSPRIFSSNNRMVKRQDYVGHLMEHSGYTDVKVWGEFEESKKKGYADNSMMNIAYYSALPNKFSTKTTTLAIGDGETKTFKDNYNIGNVTELPGSVLVECSSFVENNGIISKEIESFRDYSGNGYLFSNSVSTTISKSVNPLSVKTDSEYEEHPIENIIMKISEEGLIENSGQYYESYRQPSTTAPIIIEFDLPKEVYNEDDDKMEETVLSGIRILSSPFSSADDRAYPSKVMVIATREENPDKQLWSYLNNNAVSISLSTQINSILIDIIHNSYENKLKSVYESITSTGVKATVKPEEEMVGEELSPGMSIPCKIEFENNPGVEYDSNLIVNSVENKYYTFSELMHDKQWTILSDINNLIDPGSSSWGEWIGLETSGEKEKIVEYKDGIISNSELPFVFKHYRIIIFGQHGLSSKQNLKINKISFLTLNNSSIVDYKTGNIVVKFENAPKEDSPITVTTVGEIISEYQYLSDYAFIKKMNHFTTEINYKDPKIKRIDLSLRVVYDLDAEVSLVKNDVETYLTNLFEAKPGIIGSPVRLSTIYSTVMSVEGVKYCVINFPTSDIEADVNEILYLTNTNIEYQSSARLI